MPDSIYIFKVSCSLIPIPHRCVIFNISRDTRKLKHNDERFVKMTIFKKTIILIDVDIDTFYREHLSIVFQKRWYRNVVCCSKNWWNACAVFQEPGRL